MKKIKSLWSSNKLHFKKINPSIRDFSSLIFCLVVYFISYILIYIQLEQNKIDSTLLKYLTNILLLFLLLIFISIPYCFVKLMKRDDQLSKSWRLGYFTIFSVLLIIGCLIWFNSLINYIKRYIIIITRNNTAKDMVKAKIKDPNMKILNIQLVYTILIMIVLCTIYLLFCVYMLTKELNYKYALFVSDSIKSILLAVASSFTIMAALSYSDINDTLRIFAKNINIVVGMLYPIFGMYEYTYKKINEYEKKSLENEKKIIISENYIG